MLDKSINHVKGPPPPVAPKPSWARQTNTAIANTAAATVAPAKTSSSTYSPSNNENDKPNNNLSPSNVNATERNSSQKFNRSSSMNQISTNLPPPPETPPSRNKSLSVPDSRSIPILILLELTLLICTDFQKVFKSMHFASSVSSVEVISAR